MNKRVGTIISPIRPEGIPSHSQWLLGQGAGVWFCIDATANENKYLIKRYTLTGELDCERIMDIEEIDSIFDIEQEYEFTHISHCAKCRIIQNGVIFIFNYQEK